MFRKTGSKDELLAGLAEMDPNSPADTLIDCPNRKVTDRWVNGLSSLHLTCPKYEKPVDLGISDFSNRGNLREVAMRLGCVGCSYSDVDYEELKGSLLFEKLHPEVSEASRELFEDGHYPQAANAGFMVVRGRLRDLTGYERGSEAFGKGGLHIEGVSAEHVDPDYQQAAQFLMMGIDFFRNVGAHSDFVPAAEQESSFQFLMLSSLAMSLLDKAEVPENSKEE